MTGHARVCCGVWWWVTSRVRDVGDGHVFVWRRTWGNVGRGHANEGEKAVNECVSKRAVRGVSWKAGSVDGARKVSERRGQVAAGAWGKCSRLEENARDDCRNRAIQAKGRTVSGVPKIDLRRRGAARSGRGDGAGRLPKRRGGKRTGNGQLTHVLRCGSRRRRGRGEAKKEPRSAGQKPATTGTRLRRRAGE